MPRQTPVPRDRLLVTEMTTTAIAPRTSISALRGEVILAAVVAFASGAGLLLLAPLGTDLAAHEYQLSLFSQHGLTVWDNLWYSGRYTFVTYSVLYYPLAALFGIKLLALITIAVAAAAFALVTTRAWGQEAVWAARVFAVVWAAVVVSAAFPFALGVALGAVALAALQVRARAWFAVLALLTLLASPLAFALLAVIAAGTFVAGRRTWRDEVPLGLSLAALGLAEMALWRLFPDPGRFPFPLPQFAAAATFCLLGIAATWRVQRARPLAGIFAVYLLACVFAFAVPSALGENIARLRYMALPLAVLALSLRGWRPRVPALALLALAASWNLVPVFWSVDHNAADSAGTATYWADTASYLRARLTPNYRVEVVDTASHWGSFYLARQGLPLARGWYRQDDFPQNAALYRNLTAAQYLTWLHQVAVRYVVLPTVQTDYSAQAEAALIRSAANPLQVVARLPHATVYSVPDAHPIATGPGRADVTALTTKTLALTIHRPGRYRVAVRYSPYWHASHGCIARGPDGSIALSVGRPERLTLEFDVKLRVMVTTLVDPEARPCAATG